MGTGRRGVSLRHARSAGGAPPSIHGYAFAPQRAPVHNLKITPRTAALRTSNDHPPFGNGFRARHARGCAHHGAGGAVSVHAARANTIAAAAIGRTANDQRAVGQESGTRSLSADPAQYFCRPPYAVSQRGDGLRIARAPAKGLYEHLYALNRAATTLVTHAGNAYGMTDAGSSSREPTVSG